MVRKVLTLAGFVEGKTFKETRFLKPPKETYAVYLDLYSARGSDNSNELKEHNYTIELYSNKADSEAENRIENSLNSLGIRYVKDPRYWLLEEELYQVIYQFDYTEK